MQPIAAGVGRWLAGDLHLPIRPDFHQHWHLAVPVVFGDWWSPLVRIFLHILGWITGVCCALARVIWTAAVVSHRWALRVLARTASERGVPLTADRSSMEAGKFCLLRRGEEWDEVMLMAPMGTGEWMCYTVTEEVNRFMWTAAKLTVGNFRLMSSEGADRVLPQGIPPDAVNWMIDPADVWLARRWSPTQDQLLSLQAEARQVVELVALDAQKTSLFTAGSANTALTEVGTVKGQVVQAKGQVAETPGHPSSGPASGQAVDDPDLDSLIKAVADLKMKVQDKKGKKHSKSRSTSGSSKRSRSPPTPKKKKKKKKKKSKKRKDSRSSSSSSTSSGEVYVRWRAHGVDKSVTATELARTDIRKFPKRVHLLTFAQEHPGALTAHFFNAVRLACSKQPISRSSQLRSVPLVRYITSEEFGLTDLRDKREALTLATVAQMVNAGDLAKALDVVVMRLQALQNAKRKGGSWEKASEKELIPLAGGSMVGPAGLTSMT